MNRIARYVAISAGILLISAICLLVTSRQSKIEFNETALHRDVVMRLNPCVDAETYWVGDVAELFKMGAIAREVAEADTAPITPLVKTPRPFHGYYLRAMETGPSPVDWVEKTVLLKGKTKSKETFAICIYPAGQAWEESVVYIVCPWGRFKKPAISNNPVLKWPTGDWRSEWAIID